MNDDQKMHVQRLKAVFNRSVSEKYERGVVEHGGNLWEKGIIELLDEAINETIDQFTYLQTLRDKFMKLSPTELKALDAKL